MESRVELDVGTRCDQNRNQQPARKMGWEFQGIWGVGGNASTRVGWRSRPGTIGFTFISPVTKKIKLKWYSRRFGTGLVT